MKKEDAPVYTIPITDITSDFVVVYRAVHEAWETGKYREIISKGGRGHMQSMGKKDMWNIALLKRQVSNFWQGKSH